jgi:hypothetical protein
MSNPPQINRRQPSSGYRHNPRPTEVAQKEKNLTNEQEEPSEFRTNLKARYGTRSSERVGTHSKGVPCRELERIRGSSLIIGGAVEAKTKFRLLEKQR